MLMLLILLMVRSAPRIISNFRRISISKAPGITFADQVGKAHASPPSPAAPG